MEGPSGLLACLPENCITQYNRAFSEIRLWNGAQINAYSAAEPERLRGGNFSRAYLDELASWAYPESFDLLMFALRIGKNPQCIISTTPKPTKLVRRLAEAKDGTVIITRGSTYDNAANLGAGFLDYVQKLYEGTRLGRQELYAEILSDTPGALWTRSLIEELRVKEAPEMRRIVVAIDPAVSTNEGSDETGIVVAGAGADGHYYVLSDKSGRKTPSEWAKEAVALYRLWKADRIIGEANNGGDLIERNLRVEDANVPVKLVHATKGKYMRAEPVAALYEKHKVRHVGSFPVLEDQMTSYVIDLDRKANGSPDHLDALVWALHELALETSPGANLLDYYRSKK